jgi:hypothetical protein
LLLNQKHAPLAAFVVHCPPVATDPPCRVEGGKVRWPWPDAKATDEASKIATTMLL